MILVGIYAGNTIKLSGIGDETQNDTEIALDVALNDPVIQDIISQKGVHYITDVKPLNNTTAKGYLNYSGRLMSVWVEAWKEPAPAPYRFGVLVDTDRKQILDFMLMLDLLPGSEEITIPPGSAWYYRIANPHQEIWGGLPSTYFEAKYSPQNSIVYQAIISKEGLDKLRNASSPLPSEDLDLCQYTIVYNGILPKGAGWNATIIWPAVELPTERGIPESMNGYRPDADYYLVLINGDVSRDIHLTLWTPHGTF